MKVFVYLFCLFGMNLFKITPHITLPITQSSDRISLCNDGAILFMENLQNELWKPVIGYEGLYEVSNLGRIKSFAKYKHGVILSPSKGIRGYISGFLGRGNHFSMHRIVALAFIPNPENKPCINHINGNKLDNSVENLEWCTFLENNNHAYSTGLKPPTWKDRKGADHCCSIPCIQTNLNGDIIGKFNGQHEASRMTGIDVRAINLVIKGKRKTTKGFIFKLC